MEESRKPTTQEFEKIADTQQERDGKVTFPAEREYFAKHVSAARYEWGKGRGEGARGRGRGEGKRHVEGKGAGEGKGYAEGEGAGTQSWSRADFELLELASS